MNCDTGARYAIYRSPIVVPGGRARAGGIMIMMTVPVTVTVCHGSRSR